jgi:hypothetical protein
MSDGGIGDGVSYCATIRVSGDLTKDQLKALIAQIEKDIKQAGASGTIENEARISTKAEFNATFSPIRRP